MRFKCGGKEFEQKSVSKNDDSDVMRWRAVCSQYRTKVFISPGACNKSSGEGHMAKTCGLGENASGAAVG